VGIGHAGSELDPLGAQGAEGERGVDLPEEALVGQPQVVVAAALGELGQLREPSRRVRRQYEEPGGEGHQRFPSPSSRESPRTIRSAVMGRVVMRAPTAAAIALATAAGGSMFGGSPTPFAPNGPTRPGCSTRIDSMRGTSSVAGIL